MPPYPTPEYPHFLLHGDADGQLECAQCERMRPAIQLFGCERCGLFACERCLDRHEPCNGTHPEPIGTVTERLPEFYRPWKPVARAPEGDEGQGEEGGR